MRYVFLVLSLFLFLPFNSFSGILKGIVTDTKGESLPFATVYIQGTANGTTANAEGAYQLVLPEGTYEVACRYMGFSESKFDLSINSAEVITHNFLLQEQNLEMKTITVKAGTEDPAYAIIRKTIAKRKSHLEQLQSFQAFTYLKGVIGTRQVPKKIMGEKIDKGEMGLDSAGKGIIYLCEQEADYYSKGRETRTVIRSVRESGNPNGLGLGSVPPIITFYENNIGIFKGLNVRGFISPINDNALHYYKYKYEGGFMDGGKMINKIKVTPKRAYEPLFEGTIYIVEDDWAIQGVNLMLTKAANLDLLDTIRIQQTHLPLKKDTWIIKDQLIYLAFKFLKFDITGYFVTVYNDHKVNEPMPDSLFTGNVESSYDKGANKKDTNYWTTARPIPLDSTESRDYVKKDSLRIRFEDPKYIDSMRKVYNRFEIQDMLVGGLDYNTKGYKHRIHLNSVLGGRLVNFNTVEGLNISPKIRWTCKPDTGKTITSLFLLRYGFANTHFNALTKVFYKQDKKNWKGRYWKAGIEGGKYVYQFNPQSAISPLYNTFTTLVRGNNYMKLHERWNGALFFEQNRGNGFSWNIKVDYQQRLPLANTVRYSFDKTAEQNLTVNIPSALNWLKWEKHNAAIANLSIRYQPGYTYTMYPDYKTPRGSDHPVFELNYEKGIAGIANSKADFDKWRASITDDIGLRLLGSLNYKIAAGGFLNSNYISLPDMMHLADNELFLAAPYLQSFQLAPYYKYSNTEKIYGELHVEYYLKGLLTNKIPVIRQAQWYLLLGANTFYAGQTNHYTEAFIGIDNLGYRMYRFLRVDFIRSWNNLGQSMTGVRFGLNMSGVRVVLNNDEKDYL